MAGITTDLNLNVAPALDGIKKLDTALTRIAGNFQTQISQAIQQLASGRALDLKIDTVGIANQIARALGQADTEVTIEAETRGIAGTVDRALAQADTNVEVEADAMSIAPAIESAIDSADRTVVLDADPGPIERVTGSSGRLALGLGAVGAAGAAAFGAIALGGGAAVGFGVSLAAQLEQARIGFTSMLGSGEQADAFLKNLQQFAAKTPFEFPDLVTGSRRLLAMGFAADEIMPVLSSIGNAVAAMGGGAEEINRVTIALGQMNAKGKVTAEEMMQLTEVGIPAWDILATKLGVNVGELQKMVTNGEVAAEVMVQAFNEEVPKRFGNAMEAQSKTLMGLFSTLKDEVSMALAATAEPLSEALRGALPQITQVLSSLLGTVGPIFATILGDLANVLVGFLPALQPVLTAVGEGLGGVLRSLAPGIAAIGQMLTAMQPAIGAFAGVLATIGGVLSNVFVQLGPSIAKIANLLGMVAELVAGVLGDALNAILPVIADMAETILPVIATLIGALRPAFAAISTVLEKIGPSLQRMGEAFGRVMDAVQPLIGVFANLIVNLIDELAPVLPDLIDGFVEFQVALSTLFAEVLVALLPAIEALIPPFVEIVTALLPIMPELLKPITDLLVELSPLIVLLADLLASTLVGAIEAAKTSFRTLLDVARNVYNGVAGVVESIVGFFTGIPGRLADLGGSIARAIGNGFVDAFNFVADVVNRAIPDSISIPFAPDINLPDNPLPMLPRFHTGGVVPGRPGQEMLALLTAGERVLTPEQNATMERGGMIRENTTTNITVYGGGMTDPASIAREIAWSQRFAS
jgi:tape measure domain-containing protein